MQSLQFNAKAKKLELVQKSIPENVGDNEILVKVQFAGICGTDLHIIDGEFPCKEEGSFSLGHEFSGIAVKLGKNVKHVKIGDKVVVDPNKGCFVCINCRNADPHFCKDGGLNTTIGIFRDGGWAQYCVVPDVQLHKLPDNITLEQAALCEPISCISHGWDKISPVPIGKRILVTGAGIIGNLWVSLLHVQGHKRVTVSEPNLDRIKLVKQLNTGYDIITPDELKARSIKDSNYLFDLVIDCSGFAPAIEYALSLLDFGGHLCVFGVASPAARISVSPFLLFKRELTITGVTINPFSFPKALGFLEAMGDRYLNYDKLGVQVFSLQNYEQAIAALKKGSIAKAMFKM